MRTVAGPTPVAAGELESTLEDTSKVDTDIEDAALVNAENRYQKMFSIDQVATPLKMKFVTKANGEHIVNYVAADGLAQQQGSALLCANKSPRLRCYHHGIFFFQFSASMHN
jgi:hypothetical protein